MSRVIDAVFRLRDEFSAPMGKAMKTLTATGREGNKARKQLEGVGKSLQGVGKTMTATVTTPVVAAFTASTKAALDFEDGIAKVSTIADSSVMGTDALRKGILDLSNQYGKSTTEIAEAQYSAISAGADTAASLNVVGTALKAAKAGFTDTETAIDGLTTVYNSFGGAVDYDTIANQMLATQNYGKTTFGELAQSMGQVTPIANSLNVSTQDLFSSIAILTKNGVQTSSAVTGLKAAYSNILKPTSDAAKTAKQLGLDFSAAHLQSVGWSQFLGEVREKAGGNQEAMAKLFGSVEALNAVTVLAGEGFGDMANAQDYMQKNTGLLTESYEKMLTPQERIQQSLVRMQNIGIRIGEKVLPYVEKALDYVDGLVAKFQDMPDDKIEQIMKVAAIGAAIGPAVTMFGKLLVGASKVFGMLSKVKAAGGALKFVFAAMSAPAGAVIAVLLGIVAVTAIVVTHIDQFKASFAKIGAEAGPHLAKVGAAFRGLWETLQPVLAFVSDVFVAGFLGALEAIDVGPIFDGIAKHIEGITTILGGLIGFIVNVFTGDWDAAWKSVGKIFSGAVDAILGLVKTISGVLGGIIEAIGGAVGGVKNVITGKTGSGRSGKIPENASGTSNWRGGITRINEKGGEIVDLPSGTRIIPHDASRNKNVGSRNVTIAKLADQIVIREEADIDKVTDSLVRKLKKADENMGVA